MKNSCPLCKSSNSKRIGIFHSILFFECKNCSLIVKEATAFPTHTKEKKRYLAHKNDIYDAGYQSFVLPIVNAVIKDYNSVNSVGLDYGAGPGPVAAKLLIEKGYQLKLYDPFFHPDKKILENKYDYIICCEVMEHFFNPNKEFKKLASLLKPNGRLYCKTALVPENGIEGWFYIRDTTHVVFYSEKNLKWIQENLGFSSVEILEDLIIFGVYNREFGFTIYEK